MTTGRLGRWLLAALGSVAVVLFLDSSGILSDDAEVVVDDSAQLAAGLTATYLCWWTSRRLRGAERRWRRLMAIGTGGWSVGMAFWAWYQIFSDTPLPSPSLADVGFFTLPVFALPALLSLAVEPRQPLGLRRNTTLVLVLDSLIVVGSLFILTWATALGAVVKAGAPTAPAFAVGIAYPVTDVILVVIVVLLAVTQRVPPEYRAQLWVLGAGLVGLSVSDSLFAYIVAIRADEMPPITNAGFIAGPLLVGVAALTTARDHPNVRHERARWAIERGHLLLPYVLVALTGATVGVQISVGTPIDAVEAWCAWIVLGLVLLRQIVTLLENTALLERVSATQAELAYRAQHDPLTGLANRTLFSERLLEAMERHQLHGWSYGLLVVDLDDFKAVNDSLGHATGDRLLHAVGGRLRRCVRSTDTVARIGGDEFAVVLEGSVDTPSLVGQRILDALRHPFEINGHLLRLGASIGLVEPDGNEPDLSADELMHRADEAMYAGKRRGKGMAVLYRPGLLDELPSGRGEVDVRARRPAGDAPHPWRLWSAEGMAGTAPGQTPGGTSP